MTDIANLHSQIAILQEELQSLRARYDTLLEAHSRAAERYKADYKKWRDFKRWLFQDAGKDGHVKPSLKGSELVAHAMRKRKKIEEHEPNVENAGDDVHEITDVKVEPSRSPRATAYRLRQRKSHHREPPQKALSAPSSNNEDPFLTPLSTNDGKSSVFEENLNECKAESSGIIPFSEPRKGRGRYARVPAVLDTINSRFSIRNDRNGGVDFQYDAVVRNRRERKHMRGSDCECCHEYYELVGPLPASRQPLWRTPTKRKALSDDDKENTHDAEEHKQLISRHRHHWHRAKTPPGYWDIGFPDTQEVLDINRRAAEMHKRKFVEVEVEAKNDNGRYVERTSRTR